MPVSMRVAEFDASGQRKTNYNITEGNDAITRLNPNLPVWVVVHGRESNENNSQIIELARNLAATGVQVVMLDWHEGASDNQLPFVGLEGSKWIEAVGSWGANQLISLGFAGSNINLVGHSWGAHVSYEIGAHISGGVKALVALDPAADSPLLGGGKYSGFSDPNHKFSNVAQSSYAFHSSELGNRQYALSADYTFDVAVPEGYETGGIYDNRSEFLASLYEYGIEDPLIDRVSDALREHSFAIHVFSELLERQQSHPSDPTAMLFTPEKLRSPESEFLKREGAEGVFYVDPMMIANTIGLEAGQATWKANRFGFYAKDKDGNDISHPRSL